MRNFKKFLTLVLAVMMVVSAMSFTTSAAFEDVAADNEYLAEAIDLLNYMGVAKGVSETKFGTDELVTRQQFALFIYRMMKGGKDAPANGANSTNFTDLVDPTYNYAISWAYQNNIVSGRTSTTFDPKGAITLQEAYAMIIRALQYEADGEKLAYPFGYIEVAEKETVNLPEGLASSVDATDALTRGDMAILLYNTFFAEIGVPEVKYVERELKDGSVVLVEKEKYPKFCAKFFDVKEIIYQAVGTPHYSSEITDQKLDDNGNPITVTSEYEDTFELGYDAILFKKIAEEDTEEKAPDLAYISAEDISIDAKDLDKYFLADFTVFATLDEDDNNAIEKVLYASSNMKTKTVTDIEFGRVSTNKTNSFYYVDTDGDSINNSNAKILSGKATADGETFYFFNAPYSYVAPTYDAENITEATKYELKNAENIGSVEFEVVDLDDGRYVGKASEMVIPSYAANHDPSGYYRNQAHALVRAYEMIYYGGLYEADLYDIDGDERYDYINYKPYEFFQVNTDEDYNFLDYGVAGNVSNSSKIEEVYTEGATLLGKEFEDEDFVIGYKHQPSNTIKVVEVIKPVTSKIKSYSKAELTLTLTDGTTADVASAWKTVENLKPATVYDTDIYAAGLTTNTAEYGALLAARNIDDDEIDLYIYDGVVLYQEGAQSAALTFSENLLIPTEDKNGRKAVEQFNTAAGKMMIYIYAWVDGETKWVPVETDDDLVFPVVAIKDTSASAGDDKYTIDARFFEQLCTYSVDADGVYTVLSLANNFDPDSVVDGDKNNYPDGPLNVDTDNDGDLDENVYAGINTDPTQLLIDDDDEIQYIKTGLSNIVLKKRISTRYELVDNTATCKYLTDPQKMNSSVPHTCDPAKPELCNYNALAYNVDLDNDGSDDKTFYPLANLTDSTRIVIKNKKFFDDDRDGQPDPAGTDLNDDNEIEFIEYDLATLTTSSAVELDNVSVVLVNDVDQTNREDLLLLYGEAYDFDLKGIASTKGYRIVKASDPYIDENGYYRNGYTALNPFTGKFETISGNKTASTATGINGSAIGAGSIVDLKDGKINDSTPRVLDIFSAISNPVHLIDTKKSAPTPADYDAQAGLVWIVDYDTKDNVIVVGDVVDGEDWYEVAETGSYTVDNSTVVTLLKHSNYKSLITWGDFSLLTLDDIAAPKNEMKCYSTKVPALPGYYDHDSDPATPDVWGVNPNKPYRTGYAKYLKAYIVTENEQNLEEGELNNVTFMVIIANADENHAHLTTNKQ